MCMLLSRSFLNFLTLTVLLAGSGVSWAEAPQTVQLAVVLRDGAGNPIEFVNPGTNDPSIAGADFLAAIRTSDASDLATYSQRIGFDSISVGYLSGIYQNALIPGLGKNPGLAIVNEVSANIGPGSFIDCSAGGIAGYSGPQDLLLLGFEVRATAGQGAFTIQDNPESTAPYADRMTVNIPHESPGLAADYTIQTEGTPTPSATATRTATPTSTETILPSPTGTLPTPTETSTPMDTPSADLDGDGIVDAIDLLILLRQWHTETGQTH